MAELDKIRDEIRGIAGRIKNVTVSEIETVVNQLEKHGYTVTTRDAGSHAKLFGVNGRMFSVCTHHSGAKQIKACYVRNFLKAMIDLDLYD